MVTIKVDQARDFSPNEGFDTYKIEQSPDRKACI